MAIIKIETTKEERLSVLKYLEVVHEEQVSVSAIAKAIGMTQSRTRYAIDDLIEHGNIERIPVRQFNKMYVRYMYRILSKEVQ